MEDPEYRFGNPKTMLTIREQAKLLLVRTGQAAEDRQVMEIVKRTDSPDTQLLQDYLEERRLATKSIMEQ